MRGYGKTATVFGAGGRLGRHVVRGLVNEGWRVRGLSRGIGMRGSVGGVAGGEGDLRVMGTPGQVWTGSLNVVTCDAGRLEEVCTGSTFVVYLPGLLREGKGEERTFEAVHEKGASRVAGAAFRAGCERFVYMSALGAREDSGSLYWKTKAKGERAVAKEFSGAVLLRPSVVFGPHDDFLNRFGTMVRRWGIAPLPGGGTTRFQPVWAGDVARCVVEAGYVGGGSGGVGSGGVLEGVYELGGADVMTWREIMEWLCEALGVKKRMANIPYWVCKRLGYLPFSPMTRDQLEMLMEDNVVSDEARETGRDYGAFGLGSPMGLKSGAAWELLGRWRAGRERVSGI